MTKKASAFRTRFACAKKGGEVVHFSGESPKNEPLSPFFSSEASKKYYNAFFVMYLGLFHKIPIYFSLKMILRVKFQEEISNTHPQY
jgi:hypothetical protein